MAYSRSRTSRALSIFIADILVSYKVGTPSRVGLLGNGANRGSAGSPTALPCHFSFPLAKFRANDRRPYGGGEEHLRRAIKLDKDIRGLALNDEHLKPLWDWIGGLKISAGLFKFRTVPSSQGIPQLGRGFRNGEIPSSNQAFHKPASSRSQRPTRPWMAIFADNSQGSLLYCPAHSL